MSLLYTPKKVTICFIFAYISGEVATYSDWVSALKWPDVCFPGAHCLDFLAPGASDPVSVVELRNREIEILEKWLLEYYKDGSR